MYCSVLEFIPLFAILEQKVWRQIWGVILGNLHLQQNLSLTTFADLFIDFRKRASI